MSQLSRRDDYNGDEGPVSTRITVGTDLEERKSLSLLLEVLVRDASRLRMPYTK